MEEALIEEYYKKHRKELVAYTAKYLRKAGSKHDCVNDAEDIVQDLFLRLLANKSAIISVSLPALTYRIINNMIADFWRHRDNVERHETYVRYNVGSVAVDAFSYYSARHVEELIERRIARFDDSSARIIRMNILEDKRIGEIADELQMKYKTVETHLYHTRKELRRYISKIISI